ncbi:MarR family winged helix-turn-helix transcriptional regulator [Labrenzia sp. PHM005]|uniref:MarR family winged helix-turn-helix transcriptional regulator n=1 Tax=Labrenzia sp. PHM005 TaxID=2590016 RepID=UPI00114018D8|nr:MarR family transcriptional regulator [Labrenzia sp. PHM005]QDG77143.1 MarR family transcriptional regulator [Labrenzia sp. PHM005]
MSDTTNQMSLLDAIGFSEPEEKKTNKEGASEPKSAKASLKKRKAKKKAEPAGDVAAAADDTDAGQVAETDATGVAEDARPAKATESLGPADPAHVSDPVSQETATAEPAIGTLEIQPDGPLPLDKYLCFALYSANHAMHSVYKALLKEVGLTYPQFLAMTVLWDKNNVPVGAITQKLQLDTNTLTPLLKRLEAMGLLTRTRSTKDERQVILKLTRKGRNLQKKTEHFGNCVFTSTGMSLEEVVDLQNKIMKLRDNLRDADLT